jgi:hypothetical protein
VLTLAALQENDARLRRKARDLTVGRRQRGEPVGERGDHQPVHLGCKAEAMHRPRRNEEHAWPGERGGSPVGQHLAAAGRQKEDLEEGFVSVRCDLPIVQAAALRQRFGMQPEID